MSDNPSPISFILDVRTHVTRVPNEYPKRSTSYKMAVVGEAPGSDEATDGRPFVGASGRLLFGVLSSANISRDECLIANASQIPGTLTSDALAEGLVALEQDLKTFAPNITLLLGSTALAIAATEKKPKMDDYRGYVFVCTKEGPLFGRKCLATHHPARVFRQWDLYPLFRFDVQKAASEATHPDHKQPLRDFLLDVTAERAIDLLLSLEKGKLLSLDIEGGMDGLKCVSFTQNPSTGFIVPWQDFSVEEQERVLPILARVLGDASIPKLLQNSLYDNFVLSYLYKCPIKGVLHDTMLSGWEIYPELPKGLGTQTSIWTKEGRYKFNRKTDDTTSFYRYCCTDSAVTLEIHQRHLQVLERDAGAANHYAFNVKMLPILLYMELRGIRYDKEAAALELTSTLTEQGVIQSRLNEKNAGEFFNLNSPKQVCEVLYHKLDYPPQHPKVGLTLDRTRLTSNVGALLNLIKLQGNDPFLEDILRWRKLDKLRVALSATTDSDNRVRCGYNVVGTETGRLTCYESPTGSGYNLQTVTSSLRRLFLADQEMAFFQCDLAGADGWTVAAHCKRLGDPTMLDDYLAGIKPAKVIALMYKYGREVATWERTKIVEASHEISEKGSEGWLYFACKRVQHGSNYGLGKNRMSDQILQDSYKKMGKTIYVSPSECIKLQILYLDHRYIGVRMWQRWVQQQLSEHGALSCASGHRRRFFGRREAHDTYMAALAHEPQANTTYATNLAALRLWSDPENKTPSGKLIIEPLHQVHDALCGQFPLEKAAWATRKIRSYFENLLVIAGQDITIPYDGGYGSSWADCKTPL